MPRVARLTLVPTPLPTPSPQPQQTHRRPNEGSVGIQLERGKGVGFSSTETKTYKTKTTYGRRREPHMRRIVDDGGCHTLAGRKTLIRGNNYRILLPGNCHIGDATTDTLQQSSIALEALNSYILTPAGNGTYAGKNSYKLKETNNPTNSRLTCRCWCPFVSGFFW